MIKIKPFRALRPRPEIAAKLASHPYDVLSSGEAKEEAKNNPCSFYHVSKSEIDLPGNIDVHDAAVYKKAAENLKCFLEEKYLIREDNACYYIYALKMNDHEQTGLACVSAVDDYDNGLIKKHELTRPDKELDRINHIKATQAQTGNVFLAYNNIPLLDALIEKWKSSYDPVYDFTADDGIKHQVWVVDNIAAIAQITKIFEEIIPCTYIADGHHRAASASLVRKEIADQQSSDIDAPANYFLTTLFPANQLIIMDYNRVIKDLNGHSSEEFLALLKQDFEIQLQGKTPFKPASLHEFGLYLGGNWYSLKAKEGTFNANDPIGVLDITILQNNVLQKHLNIHDQRTDKRIDFVGGIRGLEALQSRVDSGEMKVAFDLYPVSIQQLFDIADSGNIMPPKSTWFEPKLRDGLLTHSIVNSQ